LIALIKQKLLDAGINPASSIEYDVNGTLHVMRLQEIAEHYMSASTQSQEIFMAAFEKALGEGKKGVQSYFEKMGQLLLLSHLSEKFEG
jgi:hypothetical protein